MDTVLAAVGVYFDIGVTIQPWKEDVLESGGCWTHKHELFAFVVLQ